jgi:hypothetical protein
MLKIVAFKRTLRKFLNKVAAHIEGLIHPPICLFETLFSCQYPFRRKNISCRYGVCFVRHEFVALARQKGKVRIRIRENAQCMDLYRT